MVTSSPSAVSRVAHGRLANAIRALAMDAVEQAKSGHPGLPMGAADVATRLEQVLDLDSAEADRRLRSLPGIGVWTSAEIRQRAAGDADAVSVGDYHLAKAVGWTLARRITDDVGMLELLLGQRPERLVQHGAIKPVLALEVVIDGGLVDAGLGDDGADAGTIIAALGEQALGGLHDPLAGDFGRSRHGFRKNGTFSNPRLNFK